jgi:phosphoglycolate phosphatase
MVQYIVFDFDGTIADTFEVIKDIAKTEFGASESDFKLLKNKGLKGLINNKKISFWVLPKLAIKVMSRLKNKSDIGLFPKIPELLKKLKNNYKLGIVSSNSQQNILRILKKYRIENLFEFIYSSSSIFGKHLVLKRMCKKYKINPDSIIYIGDEDRDILAAKKMEIKNIAVTWGFNSEERLKKIKPDSIATTPMQIIKQIP